MSFIKYISVFLFFLITLSIVYADECISIEDKSPRLRLKRHLFCDYDPEVRPLIDEQKHKTYVSIIIIPKLADFDDVHHTLNLHSWMYITWNDVHLRWKPEDFDNVNTLWVSSSEIWTPDLSIQNAGNGEYQAGISYTDCMLSKDGTVVCVPAVLYSLKCITDYKYWPFDQQNCSLELSSWSHSNDEITFNMKAFAVLMIHFYPSPEWKIAPSNISFEKRKSKYSSYDEFPTIIINFNIERAYSALWKVFVTPMFVMIIMTLTTLWFDPGSKERLLVACVNFIFHLFCVQGIHWQLPQSGTSVPNILIFYHNSIILSGIALMATCLLQKLNEIKTLPPAWLNSCMSMILSSKPGKLLLLSILDPKTSALIEEDGDHSGLVNSESRSQKTTWNHVIIIIGWLLFFSFLLTYIIMLAITLHIPNEQIKI